MQGFQGRGSPKSGIEDFPTPPWATRAFVQHILGGPKSTEALTVWEPCANRGYMVRPLTEYFKQVVASDVGDYGMGYPIIDFMTGPKPTDFGVDVDWIITNPPFNIGVEFVLRALEKGMSRKGVAIFIRTNWMEGVDRYERLFSTHPPTRICPYVGRVAIVRGRVDLKAATQMPYAWFVWEHEVDTGAPVVEWIPHCRKDLEKIEDYATYGVAPDHFYPPTPDDITVIEDDAP